MKRKYKSSGQAMSMPAGLAAGGLCSILVTMLGSVIIAKMISGSMIELAHARYYIMVIPVIASFVGAILARQKIKRQNLLVCMISGMVYISILGLVAILFYGGYFVSVLETSMMVICGCVLASMTGVKNNGLKKKRKIKISSG